MNVRYQLCLLVLILCSQTLFAQCPPIGFPEPGNTCLTAPILCENLDGYCATINNNNQEQSFPGCLGWTLNNDEWFAFFAGTTSIAIQVTPLNCTPGNLMGLQGGIYVGCGPPWVPVDLQCSCTEDPFVLSANNFVVGQLYWIVLDGCAGNVCDYTIDVLIGSTVGLAPDDPGAIIGPISACPGATSSYTVAPVDVATTYNWTLVPPIGTLVANDNNATVAWNGNANGSAELCLEVTNGCFANTTSSCTTVNVQSTASATISGSGYVCPAISAPVDLTISFTGDGPWGVMYTRNGVLQPLLFTSSNPHVLQVTQAGTYALQSMSSLSLTCPGPGVVSGVAVVTESNLAGPDWALNIDGLSCSNGGMNLYYTLCNNGGTAASADSLPLTFYLGNPLADTALVLGTYYVNGSLAPGACTNDTVVNVNALWFSPGVGNGQEVYGVVNDDAYLPSPFLLDSFPLTNLLECDYANNVSFTVVALDSLTLDLGPDVIVCLDNLTTFNAGPGYFSYLWQDSSTLMTYTATIPGTYWVEVTDACGFKQRDSVFFSFSLLTDTQFPDVDICPGDSASFSAPGFDAYTWFPATGLSCTNCPGVIASPGVTTEYNLLATNSMGCELLDTFVVTVLPQPAQTLVLDFCPGASVFIDGVAYSQPGTVLDTIPSTGSGCDTLLTYVLQWLPQPAKTIVLEFCPGASVSIDGVAYSQPGTVLDTIPSTGSGCDTLLTYQLQYIVLPQPSTVGIQCPANQSIVIPAGAGPTPVVYDTPAASTDCPCGGAALQLQGLASGAIFPIGLTEVCYLASDSCGTTKSCCFTVTIENEPEDDPCDVKNTACVKFEILGIFQNPAKQKTYRMRVTNTCSNELVYVAFQTPDGLVADKPLNASTYTAPSGRQYVVRNPNYAPFNSVRFKSSGDGIAGGQSDIFEYTLPPQADPTFIHALVRLEPQIYYETHLNVFDCIVQQTPSKPEDVAARQAVQPEAQRTVRVFPNPASDLLFVDVSDWEKETLRLKVTDALGRALLDRKIVAGSGPFELQLPQNWSAGVYQLEVYTAGEAPRTLRFVVQR